MARCRDTMPDAVSPAPTLAASAGVSRFGSGLWCGAILAMVLGAGVAFGQNRNWTGEIQPVAPVTASGAAAGVVGETADRPKPKALAKKEARKVQARLRAKPKDEPGRPLKAQTKVKFQAKSSRTDRHPPPLPVATPTNGSEQCWTRIEATSQPARLIRLSEECGRDLPDDGRYATQIRDVAAHARRALDIQRSIGLSGDFFEDSVGDASFRRNLGKAVRGDKDAAYLIALAYRLGTSGVAASSRRMEQWLRFAAELGSGLASWELAEHYNYGGLVADAARFEKRAVELGYRPPFRLPTRGY
ncbi:hypothetical protein [Sulfuritalea sp.]|uniref:hypothetical protein n=1 Tax=Sulfuritalea sp. TaxID=2480090 RepID=UPI00286DFC42|nr:hypothetical protein [Sulfuritalea sp.]